MAVRDEFDCSTLLPQVRNWRSRYLNSLLMYKCVYLPCWQHRFPTVNDWSWDTTKRLQSNSRSAEMPASTPECDFAAFNNALSMIIVSRSKSASKREIRSSNFEVHALPLWNCLWDRFERCMSLRETSVFTIVLTTSSMKESRDRKRTRLAHMNQMCYSLDMCYSR